MARIRENVLAAIVSPSPAPSDEIARALGRSLKLAGIQGQGEAIAYLAQLGTESGGFKYLAEIWGPSAAQLTYEGRDGLGNTEPGDGYKFRGRGWIQITGRANYRKAGEYLGVDLENNPDLASDPDLASEIAAWYWKTRVAPKVERIQAAPLSDPGQLATFTRITKLINGGTNGLADRKRRFEAGLAAADGRRVTTDLNHILIVFVVVTIIAITVWLLRTKESRKALSRLLRN